MTLTETIKCLDTAFQYKDTWVMFFQDESGHVSHGISDESIFAFSTIENFIKEVEKRLRNIGR